VDRRLSSPELPDPNALPFCGLGLMSCSCRYGWWHGAVVSRLFLVRHGEATGEDGDPGLNPLGVAQSRLLGERLRGEGVVEVRHGPRRRAAETAAVLGELCAVPVVIDVALEDRTPVPAPGQEALYPERMRSWFAAVPVAERDDGGARLAAAVQACLADDRQLALVTHAFVVAWFVQHILGAPANAWTSIAAANAGLTTIDRRPGRPPQVAGVNDVGHLLRIAR
jgi:serine/threonine-protein phosphatase PGAM5